MKDWKLQWKWSKLLW